MANVKITQLPLATTPLTGTEDIPLVQGTTTKQVTVTGLFTSPVMTNPTLGTVGQADLINATGLPISTGVAGLGTGVATFLGTPSSTNLRAAVTDETGTGSLVFATSPTLVTPNLGTPSVLVATNATGTAVGLTAGSAITNANLTGAVTSVGNATSLGSFTSAQLRTALTDETGAGSAVFATSPTITAPILNQINDTNNAQILGLSPTTSAVDYLVVKNGIGVGVPLHFYADGASANIGLHIQPKGTGLVTISDGTDFNKGIRFRSSSSAASAITLLDAVSTAGRVVTLPDATTTLVGRDTTDTLTNKTIAFSSNTFSGTLAIANGGTNASTAASAIENLLPAYTGNGSKALKLNSGATALEWVADGGGTVTSVAATVPSFLSIAGSPITTSGTLAFTLSGTALPTTSGGTGLTSFTSGGVVYASGTGTLATGSALTFDGAALTVDAHINVNGGDVRFDDDRFVYSYTGGSVGQYRAGFYLDGAGTNIRHYINNAEAMRLTSTALVVGGTSAINTSASTGNITINGSSNAILNYTVGGAGKGWIYHDGTNFEMYNNVSGAIKLFTNASLKATLDSAGNLGLGVTPSAWNSSSKAFQLGSSGTASLEEYAGIVTSVYQNAYRDSSAGHKYLTSTPASWYYQYNGTHNWLNAASGTAGNPISFTTAMTLDASGNLGIGTSSPTAPLSVFTSTAKDVIALSYSTLGKVAGVYIDNGSIFYGGGAFNYTNTFEAGHQTNYVAMRTGGNERFRIDSSGNVGIGTSSPSYPLHVSATGNGTKARFTNGTTTLDLYCGGTEVYTGTAGATTSWAYASANTYIAGYVNGTERMRLDSSGNLTVPQKIFTGQINGDGTNDFALLSNNASKGILFYTGVGGVSALERARIDSSGNLLVGTTSASGKFTLEYNGSSVVGANINDSNDTANSTFVQFTVLGTQVGTIKRVASTSATVYNTTSDYRLKTVTGAVTGQGSRIDALKPVDYLWKEGNQQARGFLAHEFQTVYPNSVSGDKDATDAYGNPVYQAMQASTSEVIADLVAEIQSLRKRLADAGI